MDEMSIITSSIPTGIVWEEPEGMRRLRELAGRASAGAGAATGISDASIMALLRHRNRDTTGQITSIMSRMEDRTNLAERLTEITNQLLELKRLAGTGELSMGDTASNQAITDAQHALGEFGIRLGTGRRSDAEHHPEVYNADEIDTAMKQVENELKQVNQGNDLDMIELQSLMQQRTSDMQLASNLLKAMNESTGTIIGNLR